MGKCLVQNAQRVTNKAREADKSSCTCVCTKLYSFADFLAVTFAGSMGKSGPGMGEKERASRFTPFSGGR